MWSPSKALFGNQINKRRKTHLHSPRCSLMQGTLRGAGWLFLPVYEGLAWTSSSKLSACSGRVTDRASFSCQLRDTKNALPSALPPQNCSCLLKREFSDPHLHPKALAKVLTILSSPEFICEMHTP